MKVLMNNKKKNLQLHEIFHLVDNIELVGD